MDLMLLSHSPVTMADVGGMAASVEVRSPLLNHKVIEFAAALEPRLKVPSAHDPLLNKYVLKRLLCRYLDDGEAFAEKYGYGNFIDGFSLMRNEWRAKVEGYVLDEELLASGLFNRAAVREAWERFKSDQLSYRARVMFGRYVMFSLWYRHSRCSPHARP
jgi:asparagine synthase (glutamine-hydrolysing)